MKKVYLISEKTIKSDFVRCPSCKTGRLCDKPQGIKIRAVPIEDTSVNGENKIILKCPKCGRKFIIKLNNK